MTEMKQFFLRTEKGFVPATWQDIYRQAKKSDIEIAFTFKGVNPETGRNDIYSGVRDMPMVDCAEDEFPNILEDATKIIVHDIKTGQLRVFQL